MNGDDNAYSSLFLQEDSFPAWASFRESLIEEEKDSTNSLDIQKGYTE